jgi:hypothetical protein
VPISTSCRLERVGLELRLHLVRRLLLDGGAVLQQLDQRHLLRDRLLHGVEHPLLLGAERMAVDALVGDDGELRRVDRVGAFAQDLALRALLAAAGEKAARVLEIRFVVGVVGGEHLRGLERHAVAREHVGDPALPHRHEVGFVNPVRERPEHVDAATQDLGLEARLAVQRDEARCDRALRRPRLLDDADLVVRDVAEDVGHPQHDQKDDDTRRPEGDRHSRLEIHGIPPSILRDWLSFRTRQETVKRALPDGITPNPVKTRPAQF